MPGAAKPPDPSQTFVDDGSAAPGGSPSEGGLSTAGAATDRRPALASGATVTDATETDLPGVATTQPMPEGALEAAQSGPVVLAGGHAPLGGDSQVSLKTVQRPSFRPAPAAEAVDTAPRLPPVGAQAQATVRKLPPAAAEPTWQTRQLKPVGSHDGTTVVALGMAVVGLSVLGLLAWLLLR